MKITLCGSTRFKDLFQEWNRKLTACGHAVYTVTFFGHADNEPLTVDQKETLDLVHLRKIMHSDAIVVVTKEGYVGESTRREIKWARILDKKIFVTDHVGIDPASTLFEHGIQAKVLLREL